MAKVVSNRSWMDIITGMVHVHRICRLRISGADVSVPYVEGPPGIGKSEILSNDLKKDNTQEPTWGERIKGLMDKKGKLITPKDLKDERTPQSYIAKSYHVGLFRTERLSGIPDIIKVEKPDGSSLVTEWSKPEVIADLEKASEEYDMVICFFDDWHIAPPSIQAMGFEAFSSYSISGYKIPQNVCFVLAGNNTTMAGNKGCFSPVRNRTNLIPVKPNFDHWLKYAEKLRLHPSVTGFLDYNNNHQRFLMGEESVNEQFPSPRAWTKFANTLTGYENNNWDMNKIELISLASGFVGAAAASEWYNYHYILSNIDTDTVFRLGKIDIPEDFMKAFAYSSAITYGFLDRWETQERDKAALSANIYFKMLEQLNKHKPEIGVRSLRTVVQKDKNILVNTLKDSRENSAIFRNFLEHSSKML